MMRKVACFLVKKHTEKKNSKNTLWSKGHNLSIKLQITEKVSFNIASEASYVYILSGQNLIKNAKNAQF